MNKEVFFEEFKKEVFKLVEQKDGIPEEVYKIVNETLNGLLEAYQDTRCDTNSIAEYIRGTEVELKSELNKTANERKNNEFEESAGMMFQIRKAMEENLDNDELKNMQRRMIQKFEEMNFEDRKISIDITNSLKDRLKDIQSQQNRILYSLGYSDTRIEKINDEINAYIERVTRGQEENINYIIKNDSHELINEVKSKYEEYIQIAEKIENEQREETNEDKEQSKREEFLDRINSGFTLEEQRAFSVEYKKREEGAKEKNDYSQDLPSDIIL